MDAAHTKRFFTEQFKDRSNQFCADCNAANPQWASVSLGSYFCLDCSGQHRGLGTHLSFVRSIDMDIWKESQLNKMKIGGNARLKALLDKYGLANMSIEAKYNSQAAEFYREQLRALVDGTPCPTEPSLGDGPNRYTPGSRLAAANSATMQKNADTRNRLFEESDGKPRKNAAAERTQEENDQAEMRTMLRSKDKMNETFGRMNEASKRLGNQSENIVGIQTSNKEYTSKLDTAAKVLGDLKRKTEEDSRYIWWSFCFFVSVVAYIVLRRLKVFKLGFAAVSWTWWSGAKVTDVVQIGAAHFAEFVNRVRAVR